MRTDSASDDAAALGALSRAEDVSVLIDYNLATEAGPGAESLDVASDLAQRAEHRSYAGAWASEVAHDVFVSLALLARGTDHISLGSNIAVAFSRTPMTLAYAANDVQLASGGRFILGLGSQVKPHVTRRFGMEWSHPAERMRDFVSALRAIWTSWNEQAPLDYRGPFYRHTLMTELFDPGPNSFGAPPIYVAAVNPRMTAVAAETADGMLAHPFTTQRYLREVTLPQLTAVLARAGRPLESFDLVGNPFAAVGRTPEDLARAVGATRKRIAFYASTPADRPVLERHGWGALGERLTAMSRDAMWTEMGQAIPDYVLEEFAVVGEPARVVQMLHERFGDIYDRAIVNTPGCDGPELDPVLRTEAP